VILAPAGMPASSSTAAIGTPVNASRRFTKGSSRVTVVVPSSSSWARVDDVGPCEPPVTVRTGSFGPGGSTGIVPYGLVGLELGEAPSVDDVAAEGAEEDGAVGADDAGCDDDVVGADDADGVAAACGVEDEPQPVSAVATTAVTAARRRGRGDCTSRR